jgi:hypothetical protein
MIRDFRDFNEICALLGYYAAPNGNPLPTLRDNVSVLFSWTRNLVTDYHLMLRNNPEKGRPQFKIRSRPLSSPSSQFIVYC